MKDRYDEDGNEKPSSLGKRPLNTPEPNLPVAEALTVLLNAVGDLSRVWWSGTDVDKDKVTSACLALFAVATKVRATPIPDTSAGERESEAKRLIGERLEDLASANALYGKDQRLSAPDKIARNDREISWLKDLRATLPPSSPGERMREAAQAVIDRWDTPNWKDAPATAVVINNLRAALDLQGPSGETPGAVDE